MPQGAASCSQQTADTESRLACVCLHEPQQTVHTSQSGTVAATTAATQPDDHVVMFEIIRTLLGQHNGKHIGSASKLPQSILAILKQQHQQGQEKLSCHPPWTGCQRLCA
jgi:hypothetical protein